jgi:hypothetical protein
MGREKASSSSVQNTALLRFQMGREERNVGQTSFWQRCTSRPISTPDYATAFLHEDNAFPLRGAGSDRFPRQEQRPHGRRDARETFEEQNLNSTEARNYCFLVVPATPTRLFMIHLDDRSSCAFPWLPRIWTDMESVKFRDQSATIPCWPLLTSPTIAEKYRHSTYRISTRCWQFSLRCRPCRRSDQPH